MPLTSSQTSVVTKWVLDSTFAEYLTAVRFYGVKRSAVVEQLYHDAHAWTNITYGVIAGYVRWMLAHEYAPLHTYRV